MAQIICYEVFPTKRNINKMRDVLVGNHGFEEKENKYGSYFYTEVSSMDAWQIKAVLTARGFKHKSYDKRYSRGTSYRKQFFATHKGPYRCVYCGRRVTAETLEVDHFVPVAKAKENMLVRTVLYLSGITNVNDPKNLVASCQRCNRKKSDKMGIWMLKGLFGRSKTFWIIRDLICVAIVLIVGLIICSIFPVREWIEAIIALFT